MKYFLLIVWGSAVFCAAIYAVLVYKIEREIGIGVGVVLFVVLAWKLAGAFSYLDKTKDNDKVS